MIQIKVTDEGRTLGIASVRTMEQAERVIKGMAEQGLTTELITNDEGSGE